MDWMTEWHDGQLLGWTTLRYRRVYRDILIPAGLGEVPYLDTELGIDPGVRPYPKGFQNRGDGGAFNDRTLRDIWKAGYSQDKPEIPYSFPATDDPQRFYADQLIWHDRETQKDAFYAGGAVFAVGTFGGSWGRFDLDGQKIVDHLVWHLENSQPAPQAEGTHVVTARALNVRLHPWLDRETPPIVDLLVEGRGVTVVDEHQFWNGQTWALLSRNGSRWVNARYLAPIPQPVVEAELEPAPRPGPLPGDRTKKR
jgi:hypothetical protein